MSIPTLTDVARVLRGAADVIDRNGLAQNGKFYDDSACKRPRECPVCVYGAIDVADGRDPGTSRLGTVASRAGGEFSKFLGRDIVRWNDDPATTTEQVTTELRRCATWLERSA